MTDSSIPRRRFLEATGGAASALALAGCTGDNQDTTTTADTTTQETTADETTETTTTEMEPEQSGTYRIWSGTMTTFDPIKATDTESGRVIQNVFDALTNYVNGTTTVENLLAEDFSVASDNKTYTFKLKEGATYNNGDEVTASDFVYAFERLAASPNSRRTSFILGDLGVVHEKETTTVETKNESGATVEKEVEVYKPGTLAVEATGDYELEMELSQPFHASLAMLAYTAFSAIPEGLVGDPTTDEGGDMAHKEFATTNPIGAGPFTLGKWEQGTEMTLEARPIEEYHGPGPLIEGVHAQVLEKTNAVYTYATVNMNADHPSVPDAKYDGSKVSIEGTDDRGRKYGTYGPLENGLTVPYYQAAEVSTFYYAFNTNKVDKPARQAFAHALNQQEINQQVFKAREKPAYFFTPPGIFPGGGARYNELAKEYPYGYNKGQIPEATQVMEDAGYSESNQYEFTMTTYQSASFKQASQLMQDKLGAAHVDMKYEQVPFATLLTRGNNGDLGGFSLGWIADYPAPDNFLKLLYPPFTQVSNDSNVSYFNWSGTAASQRAVDAWEKFQSNPLPTDAQKQKRNEAYLEIERANWEDAVMVTLMHNVAEHMDYPWLDKPRVGGMGGTRQKFNQVQIGDRSEYKN